VTERRFGVSTHLFHDKRLTREHLVHIAAHGFELIELFATRSHFDYTDQRSLDQLAEWLSDTRLELHSVHAPICESIKGGQWTNPFSNASTTEPRRQTAVRETIAAMAVAAKIPFRYLVVHAGTPDNYSAPGDNHPDAARRSIEEICAAAAGAGIRVALEVMPNRLSSAPALVTMLEEQLEGVDAGVCLDYGHANLMGDLGEAIETLSGHLWTTHVHDNRGTRDDHLVPYAGSINWDTAIMETQKIGYEDVLMFEVAGQGDPVDVLQRTARARERLERAFVTF
jgi:sugar phosphate isomerase/epimerase